MKKRSEREILLDALNELDELADMVTEKFSDKTRLEKQYFKLYEFIIKNTKEHYDGIR